MNYSIRIFSVALFFFILSSNSHKVNCESRSILLLHSYNKGLTWTDDLNESIVHTLYDSLLTKPDIRVEYLDAKRFDDSIYYSLVEKYLINKYASTDFELIISTDNAAFDFFKKNKQKFVKSTPVVFCGVNNVDEFPSGFTGIVEDIDMYSNLKSIIELHPDINTLYIIVDRAQTGNLIYNQIQDILLKDFKDLNYEFLRDYSYQDLKGKLKLIQPGNVILLLSFNNDINGLAISDKVILDDISPYCNVPIYGVWDFYLNKGIVGGKITSASFHGEEAAQIALRILSGELTDSIEVVAGTTKYFFDNNQLKKYSISKTKLPSESIIINLPQRLIAENLNVFLLLSLTFLILSSLIVALIRNNNKKKSLLEKERIYLSTIEEKQRFLVEALGESRKAQELQKAFFANVSHEIRTPLNGILGFSDLLNTQLKGESNARLYTQYILDNGTRLLNIIDNIIEISRIESDLLTINKTQFNLNDLLDGLFATYVINAEKRRNLELNLYKDKPKENVFVLSDESKIETIMRNLLDNALRFTSQGKINFGYKVIEGAVCFYVEDSGIGIEPKDFDVVFSRFGQVEKGFNRKYQGSGLGLPITKAYVKKMGGEIWIESELLKGSKFSFTLPLEFKPVGKVSQRREQLSYDWSNNKVLIADDDFTSYLFLAAILRDTKVETIYASDGFEALKICKKIKDIDLVLMDIKMPGLDGIEASKRLFTYRKNLPIIIQTAHNKLFSHKAVEDSNIVDFIFKPIKKDLILKKLDAFLNVNKKTV